MNRDTKIYIAGHEGMVGSAIMRVLKAEGCTNIVIRDSTTLDLRNQEDVLQFFHKEKPKIVINAAARVGGIIANRQMPYSFIMDNLQIQNNLIDVSHKEGVLKFIFLGSSCIYPKMSPQPIKEEYLLTAALEPTNEWYAIAKIAGVKSCEALRKQYNKEFLSLMPTNLYGPFDNFDLESSHVLPAMIRKFHEAKINHHETVILWGSGKPRREFLHVDDMARGTFLAINEDLPDSMYNLGYGTDISISELATVVQEIIGHKGSIHWDTSKPDGTQKKLMDSSKIFERGFVPKISLEEGISKTYQWFLKNQGNLRKLKLKTERFHAKSEKTSL